MEKETNLEHYKKRLKSILKKYYKDPCMIFFNIQNYIDPEIKTISVNYTNSILVCISRALKKAGCTRE